MIGNKRNAQIDRTDEFIALVKGSRAKTKQNDVCHQLPQASNFTIAVASISQDLTRAFAKLEKLTSYTRHQTMNDSPLQIQEMIGLIKNDIEIMNNKIDDISKVYNLPSYEKQLSEHSNAIINGLRTQLAKVSDGFKSILEKRQQSLKDQAKRRGQYVSPLISNGALNLSSSVLLEDENRFKISDSKDIEVNGPLLQTNIQQQLALVDQTESYLLDRADKMKSIEHTIVQLGEIFQNLAVLIHSQEETVKTLHDNVEGTSMSIEAGHRELLKYFNSISSNRWLMAKAFGIVLIFVILFIFIFA